MSDFIIDTVLGSPSGKLMQFLIKLSFTLDVDEMWPNRGWMRCSLDMDEMYGNPVVDACSVVIDEM